MLRLLTLGASCLAAILATFALVRVANPLTEDRSAEIAVLERSVGSAEQQVEKLRELLLAMTARGPAPQPAPSPTDGASVSIERLALKTAELEAKLDLLLRANPGSSQPPSAEAMRADIAEHKSDILNSTLPDTRRVDALARLRWYPADLHARDADVIRAALDILSRTKDGGARLAVVRNLRGLDMAPESAEYHMVYTALATSLQSDAISKVREEAAQSLTAFRSVPFVAGVLTDMVSKETDFRVKYEIERAIRGER